MRRRSIFAGLFGVVAGPPVPALASPGRSVAVAMPTVSAADDFARISRILDQARNAYAMEAARNAQTNGGSTTPLSTDSASRAAALIGSPLPSASSSAPRVSLSSAVFTRDLASGDASASISRTTTCNTMTRTSVCAFASDCDAGASKNSPIPSSIGSVPAPMVDAPGAGPQRPVSGVTLTPDPDGLSVARRLNPGADYSAPFRDGAGGEPLRAARPGHLSLAVHTPEHRR